MRSEFLEIPFEVEGLTFDGLLIEKAREFAVAVERGNHADLIKVARKADGDEIVYFDIEPEVGQAPLIDIRYSERLAVQFNSTDSVTPWVYALRPDFPLVMHMNALASEFPRSLCLYETPYEELKLSWRGNGFLERIRDWLGLAAKDELHAEDQPLEPFLLNTVGNIIVPSEIKPEDTIKIYRCDQGKSTLGLRVIVDNKNEGPPSHNHHLLVIRSSPQVHGYLRKSPQNLFELNELMSTIGVGLIDEHVKPLLSNLGLATGNSFHDHRIVILLEVPTKRKSKDPVTYLDSTSFLIMANILTIAIGVGALIREEGILAQPFPAEAPIDAETIKLSVAPLRTYKNLTREKAARFSGLSTNNPDIGIIGVGALGSQLMGILCRMGFGKWRILDSDILLPHNLVRHELGSAYLGFSKSEKVALEMNSLMDEPEYCVAVHDDYLKPGDEKAVHEHFKKNDLIIDTSASVAVARKLAQDNRFDARRFSLFMNPAGTDLVLLAEPEDRLVRLDHLEMQYYRLIWEQEFLQGHFELNGEPIRYSGSCRDITSIIRQEDVALFSGIGAKAIRLQSNDETGSISIWQNMEDGSVNRIQSKVYPVQEAKIGKRTISMDDFVVRKLRDARSRKLPNETGGVLLGSYDQVSKTIYVVDSILSPKDSKEFPNAYYRGIDGLEDQLLSLARKTAHNLQYIGEWHSHPKGSPVDRSNDDMILFGWIKEHMETYGLPPLMLIVGDNNKIGIYTN